MSSINLLLQAIPPSSNILELAKTDTRIAESLRYFGSVAKRIQEDVEFVFNHSLVFDQCVRQVIKKYPNIWEYKSEITDSSWDVLAYLLSPSRRKDIHRPENVDLGYIAVRGNQTINANSDYPSDSIHFNIGYVMPNMIKQIRDYLETLAFEDFKKYWYPPIMGQQGVFSMEHNANREIGFLDEYDDDVILGLWDQLQQMVVFYQKVVETDLGVATMLVYH